MRGGAGGRQGGQVAIGHGGDGDWGLIASGQLQQPVERLTRLARVVIAPPEHWCLARSVPAREFRAEEGRDQKSLKQHAGRA